MRRLGASRRECRRVRAPTTTMAVLETGDIRRIFIAATDHAKEAIG